MGKPLKNFPAYFLVSKFHGKNILEYGLFTINKIFPTLFGKIGQKIKIVCLR